VKQVLLVKRGTDMASASTIYTAPEEAAKNRYDSCFLLKRYFKEPGSTEIISKWKEATGIVTSSVAYAETMASLYRKKREINMNRTIFGAILSALRRDWTSFIRVEVSDDLNEWIDRIIVNYPLRGFDAIHLASALIIHERVREHFLFACFDKNLIQAGQMEGLKTLPTNLG